MGQKQKSDLSQGRVNGSALLSERVDTAPDLALWSEAVQQAYEAGRAVAPCCAYTTFRVGGAAILGMCGCNCLSFVDSGVPTGA